MGAQVPKFLAMQCLPHKMINAVRGQDPSMENFIAQREVVDLETALWSWKLWEENGDSWVPGGTLTMKIKLIKELRML